MTTGKLSHLTSRMVPQYVQEQYPHFMTFITNFFEYLERDNGEYDIIANLVNTADVDKVIDDYIYFYRRTYAQGFPEIMQADFRFLVKQLKTFYSAKGTEKSIEFLFRTIYNTTVDFYYPKVDMLRVSDGKWTQPYYMMPGRIVDPSATSGFSYIDFQGNKVASIDILSIIDKKIRGVNSNATAYIDDRILLQLQYPDLINNYNFDDENIIDWVITSPATASIVNSRLELDRNGLLTENALTQTFVGLEENKTHQFRIQVDDVSDDTGLRVNINGTITDFTNEDIKTIGRFDVIFQPLQGGDDVITVTPLHDLNESGTMTIAETRLTVQGITYPFYGLSLSDLNGTFELDEPITVLNLEGYEDFQIVRPEYDIETGIIIPNGAYANDDGFLSYKKFIQDSFYYQEYSYELQSDIQPELYLNTIKELVHPAGFKLFGKLDVDTVRFISLDDLRHFANFLIRWTQENEMYLNGERTTENIRNVNLGYNYVRVPDAENFNNFTIEREDNYWQESENSMLDGFTFYQLDAMTTEKQMIVFVDGLKVPYDEYTVLNNQIIFDSPPTVGPDYGTNIEIYRAHQTQFIDPSLYIATSNQTEFLFDDPNVSNVELQQLFVFRNGFIVKFDDYIRTNTSIIFDYPLTVGDKIEIVTILGTINHDLYEIGPYEPSNRHIVRGTFDNPNNPIIDSGQMIDNVNDLSNILVFIEGRKLNTARLGISDNRLLQLYYEEVGADIYYSVGSFFANVSLDKSFINGDGITTVFPLVADQSFILQPPIKLNITDVTYQLLNSDFDNDLSSWTYGVDAFVWSDSDGGSISYNDIAVQPQELSQNLIDSQIGDSIRVSIHATGLDDNVRLYITDDGFNSLDPDLDNNKSLTLDTNESGILEAILEKDSASDSFKLSIDGPMDVHFIRAWKL